MSVAESISSVFTKFLKVLAVAVLLFAAYRCIGYYDIIVYMVRMRDTSQLSALTPLLIELVVMGLFARVLFWISTK